MFRWKKDKDKEKEDKKKKEKTKQKRDKAPASEKEPLTQDELKRLDEVRRSFTSQHSGDQQQTEDENSEKHSNSSDYSLSSATDISPQGGSSHSLGPNKAGSPSKKPPPIPKKPVLRVKPSHAPQNIATTPSPQGSTYSMVSLHLGTTSLTNEMMAFMEQMNQGGTPDHVDLPQNIPVSPAKPSVPSVPPAQLPPGEHGGYGTRWKSYALDLRLPEITPLKPPRLRSLKIKRQPTGDFGFSLRRAHLTDHSPSGESKQEIIFAEPSSMGKANDTGLLPGDRLLEVNGASVESKTREETIDLIRSSGEHVLLNVQPVPELRELNIRCGLDGKDIEMTEQNLRTGTLSHCGSYRFKSSTKSEEQLEVEKSWLKTEMVWVIHKCGFSAAHLVKTGPVPPEGKVRVKLQHSGDEIEVDEEDVEKVNPPQFDYTENVAQLRHVNESSLLHTLRQRYYSRLVYTYAGTNLLIINPVQPLAAYSEKVMRMFKGCKEDDMPPHIYALAQSTLNSLLRMRRDQSIVLLGRSGSGKTTNFRHLLQFIVHISSSPKQIITGEKLNAALTLLESFGNSRTVMNTNATRFSHLFTLDFDHSGQIVSASVQIYMLEKGRICRRPEGEPNFHIFYQLVAGVDDKQRRELYLDNLKENNLFMTPLQQETDIKKASLSWVYICAAMHTLRFHELEVKAIWYILAAIYHLGVAGVIKGGNGRFQFAKPQSAQKAASLLGVSVEELAKSIFAPDQCGPVSGKVSPRCGDGTYEAGESLQSVVSGLYSEVFSALVFLINRSLAGSGRSMASIHLFDGPGFQNPATCGRASGATLEDLCHNYCQERLQQLFHDSTFLTQQERYVQENIEWNREEFHIPSPALLLDIIDHSPQQGAVRASTVDLREVGRRGLLWLLDEESLFPGSTEKSLLDKVFTHYSGKEYQPFIRKGPYTYQFTVQHFQGTNPVVYSVAGWLRSSREHPAFKQACLLLQDSHRENISKLVLAVRGLAASASSAGTVTTEGGSTLRRSSSIRRVQNVSVSGVKRRSLPLQVKYTMDGLLDLLRRTKLHFAHTFLSQHNTNVKDLKIPLHSLKGHSAEEILNIPLLRSQIRGAQVLDAVRVHKQGFPENLMYSEFRRRFELLSSAENRIPSPIYDERQAVETLLGNIDIEKTAYRLGLSQIFLRSGTLASLEAQSDEKLNGVIISFQAHSRGFLARTTINKLKVQDMALRCIQRNVRKFLAIRSWPWWRLYVKVQPVLNVHRTEEELRLKTEELENLKAKLERTEKERNDLKHVNEKLETKVSELWADLNEEQSSGAHTSEMLEAETTERMRLEKETQELQSRYSHMQHKSDKMELEMMEARVYRSEVNGDVSEDEDAEAAGSIYKQKYERAVRDMEIMKRRLQQQHEEEMEQKQMIKKATDKRLAEALEDVEEEKQVVNQWKRKAQKLGSELQDLRLMLEEQMARNGELEKKQRRFDADLSTAQEEIKKERQLREKLQRERDQSQLEKYSLEQELHSTRLDMDMQHEKVTQLNKELDELTLSSKGEEEVTQLKRAKQELERKARDQEEELEELAGQAQMLEQAKLRLEMSLEKLRQEHRREISVREEEIEEIRAGSSKKIKNLEAQLESEQEDRHQLVKQKHELERHIIELSDQPPPQDPEIERRLRRDLKRTKALFRDAQSMLEQVRDSHGGKTLIRQLKNQLEDAEFTKTVAVKARQSAELELQDLQSQLEEVTRTKNEAESRYLQLSREKSAFQTQLEEMEEEMAEVMKKYKAVVSQMSTDQKSMVEQNQQISELESEKQALKEQLSEMSSKLDHFVGQSEDTNRVHRLDAKVRDLESKLELEQTTHSRLEHQMARLKEQYDRMREECDSLRNKELQAQEATRRLQRQIREMREDYAALQQKESEAYRKQHELEIALENTEADLQVTKNDLRLACQRIQDLQNALEDDLDSGTDVPDDSGSDSDSSLDASLLGRRQYTNALQRSDSLSSNASTEIDGRQFRIASLSQDLSDYSKMMRRRTSMDFLI